MILLSKKVKNSTRAYDVTYNIIETLFAKGIVAQVQGNLPVC